MHLMKSALALALCLCLSTAYGATVMPPDTAEQLFLMGETCIDMAADMENEEAVAEQVREAIDAWERAALLGHPVAMAQLASVYHEEEEVHFPWMNEAKSEEWLKRAQLVAEPKAKAGDVKAQYAMSIVCDETQIRAKDPKESQAKAVEAQTWCRKAAEGGYAPAMEDLAYYPVSDDLKTCAVNAIQWLTRAAEKGHLSAMFKLAKLYSDSEERSYELEDLFFYWRGDAETEAKFAKRSLKQLIEAAEAGDLDAQFALIEKYEERGSLLLSLKWAERWEENFVKQTGLEANPEEAKKWLRKAMETAQKAFPVKPDGIPKARK